MTAGSGILQGNAIGKCKRSMHGFQLWANLPGSQKMVNPRYQDVSGFDIPLLEDDDGSKIKAVVGSYKGIKVRLMVFLQILNTLIYVPPLQKRK